MQLVDVNHYQFHMKNIFKQLKRNCSGCETSNFYHIVSLINILNKLCLGI